MSQVYAEKTVYASQNHPSQNLTAGASATKESDRDATDNHATVAHSRGSAPVEVHKEESQSAGATICTGTSPPTKVSAKSISKTNATQDYMEMNAKNARADTISPNKIAHPLNATKVST